MNYSNDNHLSSEDEAIMIDKVPALYDSDSILNFYRNIGSAGMHGMTQVDKRLEWEIPLLEECFRTCRPGPLLDVGCGNGRVALPLAERGYVVDGLDLVADFVHEAQGIADARGLPCRFFTGDLFSTRHWDRLYRGAFMMWGTFRHALDEARQVAWLRIVAERMESGAVVLVDTIDEGRLECAPNLDNGFQKRLDGAQLENPLARVLHKESGGVIEAFCYTEQILIDRFEKAGFSQIRRVEIEPDQSRLVLVGVKV